MTPRRLAFARMILAEAVFLYWLNRYTKTHYGYLFMMIAAAEFSEAKEKYYWRCKQESESEAREE